MESNDRLDRSHIIGGIPAGSPRQFMRAKMGCDEHCARRHRSASLVGCSASSVSSWRLIGYLMPASSSLHLIAISPFSGGLQQRT